MIQLTPGTHGLWDIPGELEVRWAGGGSVREADLSKSKKADESGRTFGSRQQSVPDGTQRPLGFRLWEPEATETLWCVAGP